MSTARESTTKTIGKMLDAGAENFGCEPVGVVLIYPNQAFIKGIWTNDTDRSDAATALIDAAADEFTKAAQ